MNVGLIWTYMKKVWGMKSETLHRTDNSAVTDVVLEKKKLLLHRVFEFGNPSKYVPRVTGLNFLDQVRCSAILIPRWLTIAVALCKRTRTMVFIGKRTFLCSAANLSAVQKVVSPPVRYISWFLHEGLIRRDHIHSHCRSNWGYSFRKGPVAFFVQ